MKLVSRKEIKSCLMELPREQLVDLLIENLSVPHRQLQFLETLVAAQNQPVSINVRIHDKGVDLLCTSDEGAETISISGRTGSWIKLALLKHAEHSPLSGLWSFAIHQGLQCGRINGINNEAMKAVRKAFPTLGLRLVCCEKGSRAEGSLFRVEYDDHSELNGSLFLARSLYDDALGSLKKQQDDDSLSSLVEAIENCPIFFPPYLLLSECLQKDKNRSWLSRNANAAVRIRHGAHEAAKWLKSIKDGFSEDRIPPECWNSVKEICISEIEGRLGKLSELDQLLVSPLSGEVVIERNPVNRVLTIIRKAVKCRDMGNIDRLLETNLEYVELRTATLQRLTSDGGAKKASEGHCSTESARKLDKNDLDRVLVTLEIEKESTPFPEPDGRSNRWREATITIWLEMLLSSLEERTDPRWVPLHGDVTENE